MNRSWWILFLKWRRRASIGYHKQWLIDNRENKNIKHEFRIIGSCVQWHWMVDRTWTSTFSLCISGWSRLEDVDNGLQIRSQYSFYRRISVKKKKSLWRAWGDDTFFFTEQLLDCISFHQRIRRRKRCRHKQSVIGKGRKVDWVPLLD